MGYIRFFDLSSLLKPFYIEVNSLLQRDLIFKVDFNLSEFSTCFQLDITSVY